MRVMVLVKASKESEAGVMPGEKILTEMGAFNEELVKAGLMLAGELYSPKSIFLRSVDLYNRSCIRAMELARFWLSLKMSRASLSLIYWD